MLLGSRSSCPHTQPWPGSCGSYLHFPPALTRVSGVSSQKCCLSSLYVRLCFWDEPEADGFLEWSLPGEYQHLLLPSSAMPFLPSNSPCGPPVVSSECSFKILLLLYSTTWDSVGREEVIEQIGLCYIRVCIT